MTSVETKERLRVLIIEDDQDDVFLLKRALDSVQKETPDRKIEYEEIDNGLDAIYLVSRKDLINSLPDALVLDLNMPRLDGLRFLRSLREALRLKDLPVFVLTTTRAASVHQEAMQAGANRVYVKPNDTEALRGIAAEIIDAVARNKVSEGGDRRP